LDVYRRLAAHALEGGSIQNINCRDVFVADRQPFADATESNPERASSARRLDRLADAAKVMGTSPLSRRSS
jgi:hypothetical protein